MVPIGCAVSARRCFQRWPLRSRREGVRGIEVRLLTAVAAQVVRTVVAATTSRAPRSTACPHSSDGKTEFFYGTNAVGDIDVDDIQHGHAVIKNGNKRRPGESTPVVDTD
jgi:hypothetical protein